MAVTLYNLNNGLLQGGGQGFAIMHWYSSQRIENQRQICKSSIKPSGSLFWSAMCLWYCAQCNGWMLPVRFCSCWAWHRFESSRSEEVSWTECRRHPKSQSLELLTILTSFCPLKTFPFTRLWRKKLNRSRCRVHGWKPEGECTNLFTKIMFLLYCFCYIVVAFVLLL